MTKPIGKGKGNAWVRVFIYDEKGKLVDIIERKGNVFLICGVQTLWNIIAGNITSWQLGICVGNGTTPASNTQTCLQGSSQACANASSVTVSNNTMIVTATFGGNQANFTWNEVCVAFTNLTCPNCNFACIDRLQTAIGTKQSGFTWTVQMGLQIT